MHKTGSKALYILFQALICHVSAMVTRQKKHIPAEVLKEFGRFAL